MINLRPQPPHTSLTNSFNNFRFGTVDHTYTWKLDKLVDKRLALGASQLTARFCETLKRSEDRKASLNCKCINHMGLNIQKWRPKSTCI